MKKFIITAICLWGGIFLLTAETRVGNRVGELTQLLKPNSISVDSQHCYITDGTSVLIYSLKDFKLIKKFGKRGEGPGEFRDSGAGIKTTIHNDYLIVQSAGRESFFKKNGTFIKEKNINPLMVGMKPFGKKFVSQKLVVDKEKKSFDFAVILYNKDIKQEKDLYRFQHPFFAQKRINPFGIRGHCFRIYKDKLFIDDKEGNIKVFDANGSALETIRFPYEKIKITPGHQAKIRDHWKYSVLSEEYKRFKDKIIFPGYFPHLRDFQVIDDKIYVITPKEEAGNSELIILTASGKLLKRTWVPLADTNMFLPQLYNYYTIYNSKLYRVVQNPDSEDWELHINAIAD